MFFFFLVTVLRKGYQDMILDFVLSSLLFPYFPSWANQVLLVLSYAVCFWHCCTMGRGYHVTSSCILFVLSFHEPAHFFSWNVETPNYISWSFTFFLGNVDTLIPLLKYSGIHVLSDTKSRTRVQKCSTDVRYSGRHLARDQQNNSVWLDW